MQDLTTDPREAMFRESVDVRARLDELFDSVKMRYPVLLEAIGSSAGMVACLEPKFPDDESKVAFIAHAMTMVKQAIVWLEDANETSPIDL